MKNGLDGGDSHGCVTGGAYHQCRTHCSYWQDNRPGVHFQVVDEGIVSDAFLQELSDAGVPMST